MSRPYRLLMIRHGQSESNIVQSAQKVNSQFEYEELINSRVDWKQRLSDKGRSQAEIARANLSRIYPNGLDYFNSFYVSPFIRARETASILSAHNFNIRWNIEDRLSERIWGIYGTVSRQEQRSHFPLTSRLANDDPWYIRYDGGESLFDVYNRFKNFEGKLWRENSSQNVLLVAHKQLIQAACYELEKMSPEEWDDIWNNEVYNFTNLGAVEYSRVNPHDGNDVRDRFAWRRVFSLADIDNSPLDGEWIEFTAGKTFSSQDLQNQIDEYPPLI
ncbi:histidine phosphatase family protein [Candidatus Saccharibacteria bacterium]|nr:histidine phosphatase family protein [Candidatus Saccharibacteria bacterium]